MLGVAIYMMYNHAKMVASMKHKDTSTIDNIRLDIYYLSLSPRRECVIEFSVNGLKKYEFHATCVI